MNTNAQLLNVDRASIPPLPEPAARFFNLLPPLGGSPKVPAAWPGLHVLARHLSYKDLLERCPAEWPKQDLEIASLFFLGELVNKPLVGYLLPAKDFLRHHLATAILATLWSQNLEPQEHLRLFASALIHDAGKLLTSAPLARLNDPPEVPNHASLLVLEKKTAGIDHQEAGRILAASWGLPDNMATLMARHHGPHDASDDLAQILALANRSTYSLAMPCSRIPESDAASPNEMAPPAEIKALNALIHKAELIIRGLFPTG